MFTGQQLQRAVFKESFSSIKGNLCGAHDSLSFISHLNISALSHKVEQERAVIDVIVI